MSLKKHLILVENLFDTIKQLKLKTKKTLWQNYYNFTNYDSVAFSDKKEIIKNIYQQIDNLKLVYDLGANDGTFSRIVARDNVQVLSFDIDPIAVNNNYLYNKQNDYSNILPLLLDLTNPSPAIGWANKERHNLMNRAQPDMIMALAIVHHLAIGNNIPFDYIASYFSQIAQYLLIEFVPKEDSQVQSMLCTRSDIYAWYTQVNFEETFLKQYDILQSVSIKNSQRIIYLMKRKEK